MTDESDKPEDKQPRGFTITANDLVPEGKLVLKVATLDPSRIKLHTHPLKYPEFRRAWDALEDKRAETRNYRMITREEWLAEAAAFYDYYTSLRG